MKPIVIVGPTGVGKTKLSIALAHYFNGEIINTDSTQVYQGLDIATAKIKEEEKEGIIHHLFDICSVTEDYTVYQYQKDCRCCIKEIINRGHVPILVGGTGLYINAVLYDYQFEDEEHSFVTSLSTEELYQQLLQIDPETRIHSNNRKRIMRSLEYYQNHHISQSKHPKAKELLYPSYIIGLTTERDLLYKRINDRVDNMLKEGLLEEAKHWYDSEIRSKAIMTPIGYKELFPYFAGIIPLELAVEEMKKNSRHYAKRQYTWFHNQMDVMWFQVDFDHFNNTVQEVIEYIKKETQN